LTVDEWNPYNWKGDDPDYATLFQPLSVVDYRRSTLVDGWAAEGYFVFEGDFADPDTDDERTSTSFYEPGLQYDRGGYTSTYTPQNLFPLGDFVNTIYEVEDEITAPLGLTTLIVISDGRCGSACCQLLTTLFQFDQATIITHGGDQGEYGDSCSFPGGNVIEWADAVSQNRRSINSSQLLSDKCIYSI